MARFRGKPRRTCLGCRQVVDQDRLVRYVLSPEGQILVDYRRKLPGRGGYTCLDRKCIAAAVQNRQFERTFRGRARAPEAAELAGALARQVRERILGQLGMARKAGLAIAGSNMVLEALRRPDEVALVLVAEDIAPGTGEKVSGKARSQQVPCFRMFDKETLGRAMGREERSVLALKSDAFGESIKEELWRYQHIGET